MLFGEIYRIQFSIQLSRIIHGFISRSSSILLFKYLICQRMKTKVPLLRGNVSKEHQQLFPLRRPNVTNQAPSRCIFVNVLLSNHRVSVQACHQPPVVQRGQTQRKQVNIVRVQTLSGQFMEYFESRLRVQPAAASLRPIPTRSPLFVFYRCCCAL